MKQLIHIIIATSALLLNALSYGQAAPKAIDYTILQEKSHNPEFFTQGLILNQSKIIETSGLYNKSMIVEYDVNSGIETKRMHFPDPIFVEGITQYQNQLFALSWKAQKVFILDPTTFKLIKTLDYQGEGWGITHDQQQLITSNGSHIIAFRSAKDFSIERTITVHDEYKHYSNINELEFAHGLIWANVWQQPIILGIDPNSGLIKAEMNLKKLVDKNHTIPQTSVLNGIAYDQNNDALWITGKFWPKRYLIKPTWPIKQPAKP